MRCLLAVCALGLGVRERELDLLDAALQLVDLADRLGAPEQCGLEALADRWDLDFGAEARLLLLQQSEF